MQTNRMPATAIAGALCCALVLSACGSDKQTSKSDHDAHTQAVPTKAEKAEIAQLPDFSALVKAVSPAVVNISAMPRSQGDSSGAADDNSQDDNGSGDDNGNDSSSGALGDWLKRFFQNKPDSPDSKPSPGPAPSPLPSVPDDGSHVSLGSGFIISSDGYILTNRHVIAGAGQIVVKLNDRRQLIAKVVGADRDSDIAVLKVNAKNLPTVKIGDSNKLEVGAWVVAIGSPFGFETSVTAGIVSAKQRSLADDQYVPFLQTDVAINPGNSGGPLFDLAGEVVGINSQIYSQTGGYQGVSFAIPIDVAMNAADQLRAHGKVTRGWLGVQIQDVDRELAKSFKLNRPEGALISQVLANSPAAKAGLAAGDVILAFGGHPVDSAAALPPLVGSVAPGQTAKVQILRNGNKQTVDVKIEALPQRPGAAASRHAPAPKPESKPFGLTLQSLDTQARKKLGLDQGGVRVQQVSPGPGADAGLVAGDVILAVGSTHVEDAGSLVDALKQADGPVALLVLRKGVRLYLPMQPKAH